MNTTISDRTIFRKKPSIRKIIQTVWFTAAAIFTGWLVYSFQARGFNPQVLISNKKVLAKETTDYFIFSPVHSENSTGFIFYPGGMVGPKAYAPVARKIAEAGYKTLIVKMPFRMASFGYHKAGEVIRENPEIRHWVLGGHSLGGAKAAQFIHENPAIPQLKGLVLIGTSHPRDCDLSDVKMKVTKIYGTQDGLATPEKVRVNACKLPRHTHWVKIIGGNHAQFGYYGFQLGDNSASISRERQQTIMLQAVLRALQEIESEAL